MELYVSSDEVVEAINYFKELDVDKDANLFGFLLSKHLGISERISIKYQGSNEEQRKALWMLAALFDNNESCGKNSMMFPSSFTSNLITNKELFQPGSPAIEVLGRVQDTIIKKNIMVGIYVDQGGHNVTLSHNYKDFLVEKYLRHNKISLKYLAVWLCRFTRFDFAEKPTAKDFAIVLKNVVSKFFYVTKSDFNWLFEDDLRFGAIDFSDKPITGELIRSNFTFELKSEPKIESNQSPNILDIHYSKEEVSRLLELSGDNPSKEDIIDILKIKKQIVLCGVPGVGKSRFTTLLCDDPMFYKTNIIQFHASYTYEEFIGGETLVESKGASQVVTRAGVFLKAVEEAQNNLDHNYLFVIDELNRGNIAEIFGETILALDRNYSVELSKSYEGISHIHLPDNFYIAATMNTSDRNIAFLDLAIRRRFAFIRLVPNYDFLSNAVIFDGIDCGKLLYQINQRIVYTLNDPELILGQSYFIPPVDDSKKYIWTEYKFKNQFNFVILPTIQEYSFNDVSAVSAIVGDLLGDAIQDEKLFMRALKAEFSL